MENRNPTEHKDGPEAVYSVAYGRLGANLGEQQPTSTPLNQNMDDGFVYSVVAARQISNGEHQYVTVNDPYETMPDVQQAPAHDIIYSSVTTNPSQDSTTKRKSTFRYQIKTQIAPQCTENAEMVDNMIYEL